jgi:multidrug resistance protein, MATE family
MHASTMVLVVTSPMNALLSYLLVHRTSLAILGAPLAVSITYYVSFILLVAYAKWVPGPPSIEVHTPSDEAIQGSPTPNQDPQAAALANTPANDQQAIAAPLKPGLPQIDSWLTLRHTFEPASVKLFLRLALPGIVMVATESWAFEIVALAAGRLGRLSLAAQSVVMTADQGSYSKSHP